VATDEVVTVMDLLTRAFAEEPIEQWCLECDDLFTVIGIEFAETVGQLAAAGALWVTEDRLGAAAFIPPGFAYDDEAIDAAVSEALAAYGGWPERRIAFWKWVEEHRPATPHYYLDVVGVDPSRRRTGHGSLLLAEGLAHVDREGAAAFLITSEASNAVWYARHGFVVRSEEQPPAGGPRVWFMDRPAYGRERAGSPKG